MNPIVQTVKKIYSTGVNQFKGVLFEHFIVYLEGYDEPFKMTKKVNNEVDFVPRAGDRIICEFDEGRMKQVKILFEHNPK